MSAPRPLLLIACGALAREVAWAIEKGGWPNMELVCLPADLHNRPREIPGAMQNKIRMARKSGKYDRIIALYGDCGTGGALDKVLAAEGVARISGAHCYEFYAGSETFLALNDEEAGSFYLTDYLVRFFDRLVIKGLGLDRYPHLRDEYFKNYKRVVHLAQGDDAKLREKARKAARQLGLEYVYRPTGLKGLADFLGSIAGDPSSRDDRDGLCNR
jgi:hypothetical protein